MQADNVRTRWGGLEACQEALLQSEGNRRRTLLEERHDIERVRIHRYAVRVSVSCQVRLSVVSQSKNTRRSHCLPLASDTARLGRRNARSQVACSLSCTETALANKPSNISPEVKKSRRSIRRNHFFGRQLGYSLRPNRAHREEKQHLKDTLENPREGEGRGYGKERNAADPANLTDGRNEQSGGASARRRGV